MKRGWWKLDCTIEPDDATLEHIAGMIREGYTSGEMIVEGDDDEVILPNEELNDHPFALSISDDDLCSGCQLLTYHPGESSLCKLVSDIGDWPCVFDGFGYSVSCEKFKDKGETK